MRNPLRKPLDDLKKDMGIEKQKNHDLQKELDALKAELAETSRNFRMLTDRGKRTRGEEEMAEESAGKRQKESEGEPGQDE